MTGPKGYSRALLRAGLCGKPALPALLGRGANLSGTSGYWVGHSSECFAVELISDREPDFVRLPGIHHQVERVWLERATARPLVCALIT